jgi:hypothetical protein
MREAYLKKETGWKGVSVVDDWLENVFDPIATHQLIMHACASAFNLIGFGLERKGLAMQSLVDRAK